MIEQLPFDDPDRDLRFRLLRRYPGRKRSPCFAPRAMRSIRGAEPTIGPSGFPLAAGAGYRPSAIEKSAKRNPAVPDGALGGKAFGNPCAQRRLSIRSTDKSFRRKKGRGKNALVGRSGYPIPRGSGRCLEGGWQRAWHRSIAFPPAESGPCRARHGVLVISSAFRVRSIRIGGSSAERRPPRTPGKESAKAPNERRRTKKESS